MEILVLMSSSIFNSKRLPKAFLTAFTLVILTISTMVINLHKTNALPAPMLTRRISLDEKMRFLRMNKSYDADFILLGSSTGVNNISSEVMLDYPKINKSFFNFSAWGFTTHELLDYYKFIDEITDPKVVILTIDLNEFHDHYELVFDRDDLKHYIEGGLPIWYYFKYHQAGMIERIRNIRRTRTKNNTFDSVQFDKGGGVLLDVSDDDPITKRKWRDEYDETYFVESSYTDLDSLLKFLKQRGVLAVIVQGPLRRPYRHNETEFAFLSDHWKRVQSIAQENSAVFFNMQNIFSDREYFFSDSVHLSRKGAKLFTLRLLFRMEQEKVFEKIN